MPKAKSALTDKNKKLTDFFTPRPSTSTPTPATFSNPDGSLSPTMSPTVRKWPTARAPKAVLDYESPVNSRVPSQARSTSGMTTRKRARSPDGVNISVPPQPPVRLKAARRPPDFNRQRAVVYVTSRSPSRNPLARGSRPVQTHSNPLVMSPDSSKQVVYSSQSDEAELVLPIPESRDLGKVVESVQTWRRKTEDSSATTSPRLSEDAMDVDLPSPSPIRTSPSSHVSNASSPARIDSAAMPSRSTAPHTPGVAAYIPSSPDTNEFSPLPPTPEQLGPDAKTAKLIAEIKARAFAANQSSDDDRPLAFRELEDSDDDDIIDELPLISKEKRQSAILPTPRAGNDIFSSPLSSAPSTFSTTIGGGTPDGSPLARPMRTSARARKLAPAFRLPVAVSESSPIADKKEYPPLKPKKSRGFNPLKALLREKQLQDKQGTSCAALRLAEEAVRQGCRDVSAKTDGGVDPVLQSRLTDEQAAWKAVHDSRKSGSPVDTSAVEDLIGDSASKMLGAVAGEAVNKILAEDRGGKGKEMARNTDQSMVLTFSLWIEHSDDDMDVDSVSITPLSGHPILTCLESFVRDGDDLLLDSVLRAGILAAVPGDILLSNMSRLLDMALFASSQLSDALYIAFRDLWGTNPQVQLPLTAILFALARLGANSSILEGLGLITEHAQKNYMSDETRLKALKRLLSIVKTAAFAGAFASNDVANLVLILVVVGLDSLTSNELRAPLNIAMDVVCNRCVTDSLLDDICEKALSFSKQLVPINKARLVSFFASGSGRARCIAQDVAYCLLVPAAISSTHQAPPLEPLILSVSPDAGSCQLFDIANETIDYEELRHHVNILSMALAEIAPYAEQERAIMKSGGGAPASPSKSKKPQVAPLELLERLLDVLQGKIVDTRAAYPDRSRAKAEIQRLAMRIHYGRRALLGTRLRPRASTLKAYFSPQRS